MRCRPRPSMLNHACRVTQRPALATRTCQLFACQSPLVRAALQACFRRGPLSCGGTDRATPDDTRGCCHCGCTGASNEEGGGACEDCADTQVTGGDGSCCCGTNDARAGGADEDFVEAPGNVADAGSTLSRKASAGSPISVG